MNCRDCLEAQEIDGIVPGCKSAEGCLIPPLDQRAGRAMAIRDKLIRLHRLKIGPEILRMHGATLDDLDLLAIAEDELNAKEEDTDNGNGSEMVAEC